jgi:hypothetical protein
MKNDELRDLIVAQGEVETQDQRIGQVGFVVCAVKPGMDGDVAVAVPCPDDRHRYLVSKNFLLGETADRIGPDEFTLDVVKQRVWGESRHPGIGIVGVAGGDMAGDYSRQVTGDFGGHDDFLRSVVRRVVVQATVSFRQE